MDTAATATQFALDEALDAHIAGAARSLRSARRVVALTGAGLSTESGIPPFRGPGGLWTRYGEPPMDGFQRFLDDPKAAWQQRLSPDQPWLVALLDTLAQAVPNAGHQALAELERLGRCACVITQNIDDLHRQAGTRSLLEIHGNHRLVRCLQCVTRFEPDQVPIDPDSLPPQCPRCCGRHYGARRYESLVRRVVDFFRHSTTGWTGSSGPAVSSGCLPIAPSWMPSWWMSRPANLPTSCVTAISGSRQSGCPMAMFRRWVIA